MVALCDHKTEQHGMKEARKHVGWYVKGIHGAAEFRRRAGYLSTLAELEQLIEDIIKENLLVKAVEKAIGKKLLVGEEIVSDLKL